MTDTPQTDYIDIVNHFTDHLLDKLRKLKAAPDKFALRNMIFLSLLATGLQLAPVHYESSDEDAKPIVEPMAESPLDRIIDAALKLGDLSELIDDTPSLGACDNKHTDYTDRSTRQEYYRTLLDQVYELIRDVNSLAFHHRDFGVAHSTNGALRSIIGIRESIDHLNVDYLPEEDVQ